MEKKYSEMSPEELGNELIKIALLLCAVVVGVFGVGVIVAMLCAIKGLISLTFGG